MISLTNEERRKFIAYLRQEAHTASGLADQAGKVMEALAKRLKTEAACYTIVADKLEHVEEQTIRHEPSTGGHSDDPADEGC